MIHSLARSSSTLLLKRSLLPFFPSTGFSAGAAIGDPEFQPLKLKIFDRDLKRKQDCKRSFPTACTVAQMERQGGIGPRYSPLAQVSDAGNLLTRADFTLPGVDVDDHTVRYDSGTLPGADVDDYTVRYDSGTSH